jgi:hypothetical protein
MMIRNMGRKMEVEGRRNEMANCFLSYLATKKCASYCKFPQKRGHLEIAWQLG